VDAFTAYDCTNWSYFVKSYSLLELDAHKSSDGSREVETVVQGEIVETKLDKIIPYHQMSSGGGDCLPRLRPHWSSARVTYKGGLDGLWLSNKR
jgi:hypothetical protein